MRGADPASASEEIADVFTELMTDVLGYSRFAAQGGDGARIAASPPAVLAQHAWLKAALAAKRSFIFGDAPGALDQRTQQCTSARA